MIGGVVFDQSYRGSQSLFVIGDKNKHFHDDCALTDVLIAASCGEPPPQQQITFLPTSTSTFSLPCPHNYFGSRKSVN